jgi:hypothetical protein
MTGYIGLAMEEKKEEEAEEEEKMNLRSYRLLQCSLEGMRKA